MLSLLISTLFPYTTLFRSRRPNPPHGLRSATETMSPRRSVLWIEGDRKSTRLNSSHVKISYAVFCLKKKINTDMHPLHFTIIVIDIQIHLQQLQRNIIYIR